MPNPYTPGAGTKPNFLAGRDDTILQVSNYLDEVIAGEMARHCIFYGVRGVGKTVLLNKMEDIAETKDIMFCHIECSEHCSLVENILAESQSFIEDMNFSEKLKNKIQKIINIFAIEYSFNDGKISNLEIAKTALNELDIDDLGLDRSDKEVLNTIIDKFGGGPVGLDTIAAATSEEATTIEDVIEPYLISLGFIARTPRGRIATEKAYEHFGKKL